jgi:hypothetical protein
MDWNVEYIGILALARQYFSGHIKIANLAYQFSLRVASQCDIVFYAKFPVDCTSEYRFDEAPICLTLILLLKVTPFPIPNCR